MKQIEQLEGGEGWVNPVFPAKPRNETPDLLFQLVGKKRQVPVIGCYRIVGNAIEFRVEKSGQFGDHGPEGGSRNQRVAVCGEVLETLRKSTRNFWYAQGHSLVVRP